MSVKQNSRLVISTPLTALNDDEGLPPPKNIALSSNLIIWEFEMGILRLDHVNVQTTNLEGMVAWYQDILGLKSGLRPNFPFGGAWLYVGEYPVVHLVEVDQVYAGSEVKLKIEHFAFSAEDETAFIALLEEREEGYRCSEPPAAGIRQYNIFDPDGNHIHVDFKI